MAKQEARQPKAAKKCPASNSLRRPGLSENVQEAGRAFLPETTVKLKKLREKKTVVQYFDPPKGSSQRIFSLGLSISD